MGNGRIIVLGDARVGKTALIFQYLFRVFQAGHVSTFQDSYKLDVHMQSDTIALEVLDTGGDPTLRHLLDAWCQRGDAFVIVFSSASRDSFEMVQLFAQKIAQNHPPGYPLALVATNADSRQEVTYEDGKKRADELGAAYFHLSAKDVKGARQPFTYLTRHFKASGAQDLPNPTSAGLDDRLNLASHAWSAVQRRTIPWAKSIIGSCMGRGQG